MERTVEAPPRDQEHQAGPARRAAGGAPRAQELRGRLRLTLLSLAVAVQIAWLTLFGWAGAILTLLPLVLRGPPPARTAARRAPRVHLHPAPATEDVAGP